MDKSQKEELKKIIIEELNSSLEFNDVGSCLEQPHRFIQKNMIEQIADNIISKIFGSVITEEHIVETLKKYFVENLTYGKSVWIDNKDLQEIASEILQKAEKWESIGEVKITDENIDNIGYWFKEYKDKKIKIAVREVK